MKDNKLVIFLVIAGFIGVGFLLLRDGNNSNSNLATPTPTGVITQVPENTTPLMSTMTITVPETNFTVTINSETGNSVSYGDFENNPEEGYGTVTVLPQYTVRVGESLAYATILAINSGGSGEFFYLAVFEPSENTYYMIDYAPLGDRIKMESLKYENGEIVVNYMEHGPDQAMVEDPNTPVEKRYTYSNGQLTELDN